jgi:hypothetical protein
MSGCVVIALMAFIRRVVPGLPAVYTQVTVLLGIITALIGVGTTTWMAQPAQRSRRNTGYRAAELCLILALTRVLTWLATGTTPTFMGILLRPLEVLLDGYFIAAAIAVGLAWVFATSMTSDQLEMALRPDDLYMTRSFGDRWHDMARPVYTDRPGILRRFTARWVLGGVLLVILAAGSRFAMPESGFFLGILSQNIDPVVITAIIIYFVLGLALISQGQLAVLRARWTIQLVPSAPGVLRSWPLYALALLVVVALIAALPPLGGTFRLAQLLTFIIQLIYDTIFAIFRLILSLFLLLFALLAGNPPEQPLPTPEPAPQVTPPPPPPPGFEVPPWAGGAVFWLLAAILLGYAAYIYFSGKGFSFAWLTRVWEFMLNQWRLLMGGYRQWQATRVRDQADAADAGGGSGPRRGLLSWFGKRSLTPEQQVRYYYLSLLEQAEESGRPRRRSETPNVFAPRLAAQVTEDESDQDAIDTLTQAFVRVRYARDRVEAAMLPELQQFWKRLRDLLRSKEPG